MARRDQQRKVESAYRELYGREWAAIEELLVRTLVGYRGPVPDGYRHHVQTGFRGLEETRKYDPRRPADAHLLAGSFRRYALKQIMLARARAVADGSANGVERVRKAAGSGPLEAVDGPDRAKKARDRNLELVATVSERAVPFISWCEGTLRPGHRGPKVATPWNELANTWNCAHHRGYDSGDALRRAYYRAIGPEKGVLGEYMQQVRSDLRAELRQHERIISMLEGSSADPSDLLLDGDLAQDPVALSVVMDIVPRVLGSALRAAALRGGMGGPDALGARRGGSDGRGAPAVSRDEGDEEKTSRQELTAARLFLLTVSGMGRAGSRAAEHFLQMPLRWRLVMGP